MIHNNNSDDGGAVGNNEYDGGEDQTRAMVGEEIHDANINDEDDDSEDESD